MKVTQRQVVLDVLRRNGEAGLTSVETFQFTPGHPITDLASIIRTLRKEGCTIDTRWEKSASGARYGRYILREEPV